MKEPVRRLRVDALATDLDGTLTSRGQPLTPGLVEAMKRLKANGTRLILVTGRCASEAIRITGDSLFDALVVENGAVLTVGTAKKRRAPKGWARERRRILTRLEEGCEEVIVSSPIENLPLARSLVSGLASIQVNKDRLMVVPVGVDKGTGLSAVLKSLNLTPESAACIGDGENDIPMFEICRFRIALRNSVDDLKRMADYIADGSAGEGALEAIRDLFVESPRRPS